jgi:elongation factor Ts
MAFTAKDVKALRDSTGCGMMDCKKALQSSDGDMDKALEYLREKGIAAAAKKSGRIAADGIVYAEIDEDKKVGALIEVNSETDFVASNAQFQSFVKTCADTVIANNPADVDALLNMKGVGTDSTIAELLQEKILTIGENIKVRRFVRMEGDLISYIHGGGRIGVMVKFDTDLASKPEFKEYAKDIAMQIAAINPQYLDRDSVSASALEEEKKVLMAQAMNEGKPEKIAEKIVIGRLNKFYKEMCLVEQDFVKDSELTVKQYTENTAKKLGGSIKIVGFTRFEKGEGLQKREDDLAKEVADMIK